MNGPQGEVKQVKDFAEAFVRCGEGRLGEVPVERQGSLSYL